jgi:hypothetical protein
MSAKERFKAITGVRYFKGGYYGPPGGGKSIAAALTIIGCYRHWGLKRPVFIYDSDRGAQYLKPLFDFAGIGVEVDDTSTSLADLLDDFKYAEQHGDFFLIDSLADPYEEVISAYLKTQGNRQYVEIGDYPTIFRTWSEKFEIPFKSASIHAIWTSKPKGIYQQEIDEEASARKQRNVYKTIKVDDAATGGKATEFGPGLTMECAFEISPEGRKRYAEVTKDRFIELTGKKFYWSEPLLENGGVNFAKLVDSNEVFQSLSPHLLRIELDAKHRQIDETRTSSVFFLNGKKTEETNHFERRKCLIEEIQNLIIMKFPGQSADEKAAKIKIVKFLFDTTVWETVSKQTPIQTLEKNILLLKVIIADEKIMEKVMEWDGVSKKPQSLVKEIFDLATEIIETQENHDQNKISQLKINSLLTAANQKKISPQTILSTLNAELNLNLTKLEELPERLFTNACTVLNKINLE